MNLKHPALLDHPLSEGNSHLLIFHFPLIHFYSVSVISGRWSVSSLKTPFYEKEFLTSYLLISHLLISHLLLFLLTHLSVYPFPISYLSIYIGIHPYIRGGISTPLLSLASTSLKERNEHFVYLLQRIGSGKICRQTV